VRGREGPREGTMDGLADQLDVPRTLVPSMRRNPGWRDLPALLQLIRIIRRERPQIVHTHAAKAGTLGRLAALCAFPHPRRRPILIHTYHGHSLTGYFAPRTATAYRRIEQLLGRATDRLIAVSEEVREELVAMRVAPAAKFEVVPLGFDLAPFVVDGAEREAAGAALRKELGIPARARVVTLIARLVPIKRVDRFLRLARALSDLHDLRFLVVGDGELADALRGSPEAMALADRLIWAGFRRDMPAVYFASDLIVQTSDNEGTPVSLIEAEAAGVPVISTDVGGTRSVIAEPHQLAAAADEEGLARVARVLLTDPDQAARAAKQGRDRVLTRFALERLVSDLDALYRGLLDRR
jgi:glycosyltransferase involved in cell wall biosynthesis